MNLKEFFKINPKVALAFSGGCDSSFVLSAAKKYGCDIKPYFVKSAFQPEFEMNDAARLSKELDVELTILKGDILSQPEVVANPANRCYYCKRIVMSTLKAAAAADGYNVIIDGTNASDDTESRPGMKILEELNILSPLRLCGITKAEVRRMSHEAGLFTWDKPSYACLATRIPNGVKINAHDLYLVENAEQVLFAEGFSDFRIRLFNGAARLQLTESDTERLLKNRKYIKEKLAKYFDTILIDIDAR